MALISAIQNQPEYELFRRYFSEKKAPLVIVSGAGLSISAGLPSWGDLRKRLDDAATSKVQSLNKLGDQLLTPRLETAKKERNNWVSFQLFKEILTPNVFFALVERALTPDDDTLIPPPYSDLLRLQPKGFVTLNLDRYAGEAVSSTYAGRPIIPIYGNQIASKWSMLQAAKTFLVYLHGDLNDTSTWVLTQDDLSNIVKTEGHSFFLNHLYLENVVLFVGVSADDIALSRRLLELKVGGFTPRMLFWITTRLDPETTKWASDNNISLIRYVANRDAEHAAIISSIVDDCLQYVALDDLRPNPIISQHSFDTSNITTDPDSLAQQTPEVIRKTTVTMLQFILDNADESALYECYRRFCDEYAYAVHRAYFKSKKIGFDKWFDYELQFPALGRGNFGEVFAAKNKDGEMVAIKIMHENIFENDEMLGGFRRGVKSMKILSDSNTKGMVPFIESYELPPTIIMEYVQGPSLEDAIKAKPNLHWLTKLAIARKIGEIVRSGHSLPQTVLHRDLKPSNIMIRNMDYGGNFDPDMVVLDFDMSWHKGSKEKDIVFESRDDFGYLAPEQTSPSHKYTARSTRVDSYGFGMTLFFLFGAEQPRPNEALSEAWLTRALRATQRGYDENWLSAPRRLARLIVRTTALDQNDRLDFSTAVSDLRSIEDAILRRDTLDNPEYWAEETLARVPCSSQYIWDDNMASGEIWLESGISVRSVGNFKNSSVVFEISFNDKGVQDRARIGKHLSNAVANSRLLFRNYGWSILDGTASARSALMRAEILVENIHGNERSIFQSIEQVYNNFSFD